MMVRCAESSTPEYSKILSISSDYDTFTISLFSPFLSVSLLGIFQINRNYVIILFPSLSRQIDLSGHTEISWLPFFLIFCSCFWVDLCLVTSCQIFPCWHTWWACLSLFNTCGGMISTAIFSSWAAIDVLSAHQGAGDKVSVSPKSQIRSCVVFLVEIWPCFSWCSSWTMGLINLVNVDVVSMYWEELEISRSLSRINYLQWSCF